MSYGGTGQDVHGPGFQHSNADFASFDPKADSKPDGHWAYQIKIVGRSVTPKSLQVVVVAFVVGALLSSVSLFNYAMSGTRSGLLLERHQPQVTLSHKQREARFCFDSHAKEGAPCRAGGDSDSGVCHHGECVVVLGIPTKINSESDRSSFQAHSISDLLTVRH
jgi:hypothetical protein